MCKTGENEMGTVIDERKTYVWKEWTTYILTLDYWQIITPISSDHVVFVVSYRLRRTSDGK